MTTKHRILIVANKMHTVRHKNTRHAKKPKQQGVLLLQKDCTQM